MGQRRLKQEEKRAKIRSAREAAELAEKRQEEEPAVRADPYVSHINDVPKGIILDCILYKRISGEPQKYGGNLDRQEIGSLEFMKESTFRVVDIVGGQESGKADKPRELLKRAMKEARRQGIKYIVAATLSRFLRSEHFDIRNNQNAAPTEKDFKWLDELAKEHEVKLVTMADPNLSPWKDRDFLAKLGRGIKKDRTKTHTKDSGYKKLLRECWEERALLLYTTKSSREVALQISKESGLKISHMTVVRWNKRRGKLVL